MSSIFITGSSGFLGKTIAETVTELGGNFTATSVKYLNKVALPICTNSASFTDFSIFPNPCTGEFSIRNNGKAIHLELYSMEGKLIDSFFARENTKIALPEIHFRIACGSGTYIRSLAFDLGAALGVGGFLQALRRTKIGEQTIEDAYTMEEMTAHFGTNMNIREISPKVIY